MQQLYLSMRRVLSAICAFIIQLAASAFSVSSRAVTNARSASFRFPYDVILLSVKITKVLF